jgi:hypothetical protein
MRVQYCPAALPGYSTKDDEEADEMKPLTPVAAAMVAALIVPSGAALAQDPASPACGEMHLRQSAEDIQFIDTGAASVDPGDRRVLRWAVTDAAGERIGTFFVVTTVLQVLEDGDVAMAEGHVVFANGDIKVSVIDALTNAANTEQSNRAPITWSINGGTGVFAGATGTLVNGPPADDPGATENWTLDIFMTCPGTAAP